MSQKKIARFAKHALKCLNPPEPIPTPLDSAVSNHPTSMFLAQRVNLMPQCSAVSHHFYVATVTVLCSNGQRLKKSKIIIFMAL
jgi:hypothetical protein